MGTAIRYSHAVTDLEKKASGYGITAATVDGMDLPATLEAARKAVDFVRQTKSPFFMVCNTYRYRAHSMFDAELYRDKTEVEEWKKRDPIPQFTKYLLDHQLLSQDELTEMETRKEAEVQKAVDYAEAGTWESLDDLTKFVYSK